MEMAAKRAWQCYRRRPFGMVALAIVALFFFVAIYAPFLAGSKPLLVQYEGQWYFPLFRYLFYNGHYTKPLDLFFNVMIFTCPLFIAASWLPRHWRRSGQWLVVTIQLITSWWLFNWGIADPAYDGAPHPASTGCWSDELASSSPYERLNWLLRYLQWREQHERLTHFEEEYRSGALNRWLVGAMQNERAALLRQGVTDIPDNATLRQWVIDQTPPEVIDQVTAMPTLWSREQQQLARKRQRLVEARDSARLHDFDEQQRWLREESRQLHYRIMPLLRSFHWEDDAGGSQALNRVISWWELTRVNRKDMLAALIFGVRISLIVGLTTAALALAIGVPIGALAGYYGGTFDIVTSRLIEIWESMPIFFMLLLIVAITQSKSISLIIFVIGLFSWTTFSRYIRGEFFKQRNLAYIEACHASGFSDRRIIFFHILPNAIPPIMTLLPFAVMAAITSEAGLSFLGLGEEGSCSWGVLMNEGRNAFPAESYLLWPPALILTLLLIAIAIVGDTCRDILDPKTATLR